MPTTGAAAQQKQPINKTIGINKLGTLLSSQSTDTPGTTQTNVQDRSGATFQTYPINHPDANPSFGFPSVGRPSPPISGALTSDQILVLILGFWPPAVTSSSLSPPRRLRKQYTQSGPTANRPSKGWKSPGFRGETRHGAPRRLAAVVIPACGLPHRPRHPVPDCRGLTQKGRQPNGCRPFSSSWIQRY